MKCDIHKRNQIYFFRFGILILLKQNANTEILQTMPTMVFIIQYQIFTNIFGNEYEHRYTMTANTGDNTDWVLVSSVFLYLNADLFHAAKCWHPRSFFFTVAIYTYKRDVTIQYYPNANNNHKKGTKYRTPNPNPTKVRPILSQGRRISATIVGLGFLDMALYLKQY